MLRYIYNVDNCRIAAFAIYFVKLASSMESPACAQANLAASAPYYLTASMSETKLPFDLDIFSPSTLIKPLQKNERGHLLESSYQIAA